MAKIPEIGESVDWWAGYSAVDKDAVCAGCVDQRRGAFDGWMD